MERLYIKDIRDHLGPVKVSGFAQTIRKQGGIIFLILRDITGVIQTLVLKSNVETFALIQDLSLESVVSIEGEAKENSQAPGGIEILINKAELLSKAEPELPIPVDEKGESETNIDQRLDWRYLDLRKERNSLIFKVWTLMDKVFVDYLTDQGFIQIHSPKLMSSPSEGGAELFEVIYFDRKAYLSQSPQFYKQMGQAAGFEKVFEIGPVFRADPSFTSRHNTEFTGYDLEFSYIKSHEDVMQLEEKLLTEMIKAVKEKYGEDIKRCFGRDLPVPTLPFPRISFAEAKAILKGQGIVGEKAIDMSDAEERVMGQYIQDKYNHEFVFITEYPTAGRAFYSMKDENNPEISKTFDLLWNGLEVTSGAQREHRYEQLQQNLADKKIDPESVRDYLNFFKYGCPPHGGLGAGANRLVMKMLGLDSTREASYLYRGVKRLTP